ncbi:MAG TPA: amidase [Mycobacteriales bacterium]|nr:amidase [Mycobacteriales bacterium]
MTQLHDLTLLEQAEAVRRREVSPVELVDHYLARIERLNDEVGAFVHLAPDQARAAAKDAESAVTSGADLAPLHGVPTAIKDLYLTADMPTGFGSGAFAPMELGIDEAFVTKLRRAGTISLGKTATPEFGAPCYTEPEGHPPARTPWDLERSAGGSSGGAGTAVASGLLPAAPGSDGGGSIRIPSSVNGLVGLKTSRGRVSTAPLNAEISGLSVHGPLARTVRDAAALLDAMAGPTAQDWISQAPPATGTFLAACDQQPTGLRIGRYITPAVPGAEVAPECVAAYEHASRLLESLGHTVEDHPTTFGAELIAMFENLWSVEFASLPVPPENEAGLRPLTRWLRERGRMLSALDVWGSLATLRATARQELERTAHFDAVLTPTLAQPPAKVGGLRDDADPAQDFENQKRYTPFTAPYNMSGQPSINVPLHWTDDGLPIGVQLVGRPGADATLLALAAQIEAAEPWAHRRPACW